MNFSCCRLFFAVSETFSLLQTKFVVPDKVCCCRNVSIVPDKFCCCRNVSLVPDNFCCCRNVSLVPHNFCCCNCISTVAAFDSFLNHCTHYLHIVSEMWRKSTNWLLHLCVPCMNNNQLSLRCWRIFHSTSQNSARSILNASLFQPVCCFSFFASIFDCFLFLFLAQCRVNILFIEASTIEVPKCCATTVIT